MKQGKLIILTIVSLLCIVILLQNTEVVTIKLLFWEISMSRIIFFPFLLVIGFVIGFVVGKLTDRNP